MLILVSAAAVFFFFAFLYKCTPPLFVKRVLLRFGGVNPFANQEQMHAQAEEHWRQLVLIVGALVFVAAMLVLVVVTPPDPEDPCTWRPCP